MTLKQNRLLSTLLITEGRDPKYSAGFVNIPPYRGSTVLFDSMDSLEEARGYRLYGRLGNPTSRGLERALSSISGAYNAILTPSGMNAIAITLLALLKSGDHVLVVDSVYPSTREFCDTVLRDLGVSVTYYDPDLNEKIEPLIKTNTALIYVESPGSGTFELQDIPAVCEIARKHSIPVVADNTWATPLYFPAIHRGVDVEIHALTKYVVGHSDGMLGVILPASQDLYRKIRIYYNALGITVGPDVTYLAARGLRSLAARIKMHQDNAQVVADWLVQQDVVQEVVWPALPSSPYHDVWKRDFSGASSLFGLRLKPEIAKENIRHMLNSLQLFHLGYSWGGYESLIMDYHAPSGRQHHPFDTKSHYLRLHIGLESSFDLIEDLSNGFKLLRASATQST